MSLGTPYRLSTQQIRDTLLCPHCGYDMDFYYNTTDTAAYFAMAPRTLKNLSDQGLVPFLRFGKRSRRYRLSQVEKALSELAKKED